MPFRLRVLTVLSACGLLAGSAGCARQDTVVFNVDNARAHVAMLAETIGNRPVGSAANAKARAYLIDQLRFFGYDVRVQEIDAVRSEFGQTTRVANIIAIKAGAQTGAIGLVAHYDSVPEAPGALDDGLGASVCLEAARVLAAQGDRQHSVMVLLTDGEEDGLMGAAAVVTDPDVKARLRAFINVEAIGATGPGMLFESGPRAGELLRAWASAAPSPRGSSYATEIYKRLPNDTDFTLFQRAGFSGLNFAPIGDSYAYHTSRDKADRLSPATIRQTGDNVVAIVRALDRSDLASTASGDLSANLRYFDVASWRGFVYGPFVGRLLAALAVLLGLFAWVRMLRATLDPAGKNDTRQGGSVNAGAANAGAGGVWRLIVTVLWSLIALATSLGAMLGAAWLLRAAREVYHPWYAHPGRFLLLLVAAGIGAPWYVTRLMFLLPQAVRSQRTPQALWTMVLPVWVGLTLFAEYAAPAAAHLWMVPLLAAGLLLAIVPARISWLVRLASLVIAVVAALFWLRDGFDIFYFVVAIFGRLPVVTPIWVYPAIVALVGLMLAPPCVALAAGFARGRTVHVIIGGAWALTFAVAIGLAYFAHAYTPERPLRRTALYLHDAPGGHAWWEVGSHEPGLDLSASADLNRWQLQPRGAALPASVAVRALPAPFVFRADAAPTPAPVDVAASINIRSTAAIEVTVMPKQESLTLTFLLPPGLQPVSANLAGIIQGVDRRWRAVYTAAPTTGVAFRAEVPAALADRLSETTLVVSAARAPSPEGPRVPEWAPQDRSDWIVRSRWIIRPTQVSSPGAPVEAPSDTPGGAGAGATSTPGLTTPGAPTTLPGTPVPGATQPPASSAPAATPATPPTPPTTTAPDGAPSAPGKRRPFNRPRPPRPVNAAWAS
jgi:uncharacterized membrane protein YuzA (DUF378 family)